MFRGLVLPKYHYNDNFAQMDEKIKMTRFYIFPICWRNFEAMDVQRIDCSRNSMNSKCWSKDDFNSIHWIYIQNIITYKGISTWMFLDMLDIVFSLNIGIANMC